jgi:hypothetical protein
MAANRAARPKVARPTKARASKTIAREAHTGEFKLTLKPQAIKALAARKKSVKTVMETLGEGIDASRKSARPTSFLIMVDAEGRPSIKVADVPLKSSRDTRDDNLDAALSAARERGRQRAAEILAGDEMLGADAFAELLGVSRVTVNAKRQKHEVLALEGAKRGFRFPTWQVDEDGKPFAAIPRLFDQLGDSAWTVYRFLTQRHSALEGATGIEALRRGESEAVIEAAEGIARGTFA